MAAQIQSAGTKLELAALGRPAGREEWIRDLPTRLGICFLGSSKPDLIRFCSERMRFRAAYARPALDEILSSMDTRPEGFLAEVQKLREILDRMSGLDLNDSSPTAEIFYSHLEIEADVIANQQKMISREWQDFQTFLDSSTEVVANIPRIIRSMCREVGQDRAALNLELRNLLANLYMSQEDVPPVVHLSYCWASLQSGEPNDELYAKLAIGAQPASSSFASHLCCRLLAELYAKEGQLARANEWARRALEFNGCPEAFADMTLLAAEMHEPALAKQFLEEALYRRPLQVIGLLADDRCVNLGSVFMDMLVRVQTKLRRDGRQFVASWVAAAKEVSELQKSLGIDLNISHELLDAHKSMEARLAEADLLTAGALIRYCEDCKADLQKAVKTSLELHFERQRETLTNARLSIDAVGAAREGRIKVAQEENARNLGNVNSLVSSVAAKGKWIEKQSILWFGCGCGLFGLFLVTKLILQLSNASVELPAEAGFGVGVLAGIPILISVGLQIYHGLGKAALDISIREKVSDAGKRLRQAELEADDFHRDQIGLARKNLSDAEAQLRKIEAAIRSTEPEAFLVSQTSPRLRAA